MCYLLSSIIAFWSDASDAFWNDATNIGYMDNERGSET